MPEIKGFFKPELSLKSQGKQLPYNKVTFYSLPVGILLQIDFSDRPTVTRGNFLTGAFSWGGNFSETLFTSEVDSLYPSKGKTFRILGREAYYQKLSTPLSPVSWRKSNLIEILQDLFEIAGVEDFDLSSCEDISISRFSFQKGETGYQVLSNLLMVIWLSTRSAYAYRPSTDGMLLFGPRDQIRQSFSEIITFESGNNILSREDNRITAFALPVLSNQVINIDDAEYLCTRSVLTAKPGKYRIEMEVDSL